VFPPRRRTSRVAKIGASVITSAAERFARFPTERNRSVDKKSRQVKKLEQVLIEKVCQLFRNLL